MLTGTVSGGKTKTEGITFKIAYTYSFCASQMGFLNFKVVNYNEMFLFNVSADISVPYLFNITRHGTHNFALQFFFFHFYYYIS